MKKTYSKIASTGLLFTVFTLLLFGNCNAQSKVSVGPLKVSGDINTLCSKLSDWLLGQEKRYSVGDLLKRQAYRMRLMQHEMIFIVGSDAIKEVSSSNKGKEFLETVLNDEIWMDYFLNSGPFKNLFKNYDMRDNAGWADKSLKQLYDIWILDPECAGHDHYKKLATAMALADAYMDPSHRDVKTYKWNGRYRQAYTYFKESYKAGKLHKMFNSFDVWEMKYLGGHGYFRGPDSLAWLNENVNIPLDYYDSIFGAVIYKASYEFGAPRGQYGAREPWDYLCEAENQFINGGVCGTLSEWAVSVACAHGIPATTVGAPGHCMYTVRFGPKDWRTGFGAGGTSARSNYGQWGITSLLLAEEVFDEPEKLSHSNQHLWRAHLYLDRDPKMCLQAFKKSLAIEPMNIQTWDACIRYKLADKTLAAKDWLRFTREMAKSWKRFPIVPFHILQSIEGPIGLGKSSDPELIVFHKLLHEAAVKSPYWLGYLGVQQPRHFMYDGYTVEMVDMPKYANHLLKNTSDKKMAMEMLVKIYSDYSGPEKEKPFNIITWGSKAFKKTGYDEWMEVLMNNSSLLGEGDLASLYLKMVLQSAKKDDLEAFNLYSQKGLAHLSENDKKQLKINKRMPEFKPFTGQLLTKGGLLMASSSAWDTPLLHHKVLTKEGGFVRTNNELNPWIITRLPKRGRLTGLVIVNLFETNQGVKDRAVPIAVSISDDGRKWEKICVLTEGKSYWRIDLSGKTVEARYIRLKRMTESGGKKNPLHLRAILAYGERLE